MQIPKYVVLQKPRGKTPLETIETWRTEHPEYKEIPASYAGRLDPMAEGKLLILLGEECKHQDRYTKLDKEYVIEIVLDLQTDTGDTLGLPTYLGNITNAARKNIQAAIQKEKGMHSRQYPVYSSKTVHGKPLFLYALEGKLNEIHIPEHIEHIYAISLQHVQLLTTQELQARIEQSIATVPRSDEPSKVLGADFRQDEIRTKWSQVFAEIPERHFQLIRITVVCGSGTYMRTLAERIGKSLGTNALALSIKRTQMGRYVRPGFWLKKYS